jgi:hypothetical protein
VSSGIRAQKSCLYISGERSEGEKESTLIHTTLHQVVSEPELHLYISGEVRWQQEEDRVTEDSVTTACRWTAVVDTVIRRL